MIRAVLCDLDGVVRLWPPGEADAIEEAHGLPRGALLEVAFERELLARVTTGALTDEAWRAEIAQRLAATHGPAGRAAEAAWSSLRGTLDPEMVALVQDLRARVPVVLLTNATTRLGADLLAAGLGEAFDAVASSSQLGVAKPDPAVYVRAAALVGATPAESVLVDDTDVHVEGARAAGCEAILHRDATTTRGALVALGLWSD